MRVIAKERGYYANQRRDTGDEFGLYDRKHFSAKWMEPVGWDPEDKDVKPEPKPKAEPAKEPAKEPIQASTETTVTPPATTVKPISPITGKEAI